LDLPLSLESRSQDDFEDSAEEVINQSDTILLCAPKLTTELANFVCRTRRKQPVRKESRTEVVGFVIPGKVCVLRQLLVRLFYPLFLVSATDVRMDQVTSCLSSARLLTSVGWFLDVDAA